MSFPNPRAAVAILLAMVLVPVSRGGAPPAAGAIAALKDGDLEARMSALRRISRLGSEAAPLVPNLIAALADREPRVRIGAAKILGGLGREAESAGDALIAGLSDPQLAVRLSAAKALARVPTDPAKLIPAVVATARERPEGMTELAVNLLSRAGPRAVPAAIALLGDRGTDRVTLAAQVLEHIGEKAASATLPLLEAARGSGRELRMVLALSLAAIGPPSLPALMPALRDRDPRVRGTAARAITRMGYVGAPALPALLEAIIDPGWCDDPATPDHRTFDGTQAHVEIGLGYHAALFAIGPEALKALVERLDSPRPEERAASVRALRVFRSGAVPAVPRLVGLLARPGLRAEAAESLGWIGFPARGTVPMLVTSLKMKDPELRYRAAEALGRMGLGATPGAREAIRGLAVAIKDPEPRIRLAAATSISQMSPSQPAETIPLVRDPDADVRIFALTQMGNRDKHGDALIDDIIASMRDPNPLVRRAAAIGLDDEDMGRDRVVVALLAMLADPDPEARTEAAINLAMVDLNQAFWIDETRSYRGRSPSQALVKAPGACKVLREALENSDRRVRIAAAHALTAFKGEAAEIVPQLVLRLKTDPAGLVRAAAASTLGRFGEAAIPALPDLLEAIGDPTGGLQAGKLIAFGAAQSIRSIRREDSPAITRRLLELLNDRRPVVRQIATQSLTLEHPSLILALCSRLKDPKTTPEGRAAIIELLASRRQIIVPGDPFVLEAPGDIDAYRQAIRTTLPILEAIAFDFEADDRDRMNAISVATAAYPDAKARARLILEVYGRGRLGVPEFSALGSPDASHVEPLLTGLEDPDRCVRTVAAYLAFTPVIAHPSSDDPGTPRNRVIAGLTRALEDTEPQVRWSAAMALGDLGQRRNRQHPNTLPAATIAKLQAMLRDPTSRLRPDDWATYTDPTFSWDVPRYIPNEPRPKLRAVAARALGSFAAGGEETVLGLVRALDDEDPLVRWYTIHAIGEFGLAASSAVDALVAELGHRAESTIRRRMTTRYFAASVLGGIGEGARGSLPALIEALKTPEPWARNAAVLSMAKVAPREPSTIRELARVMHDPYDAELSNNARAALLATGRLGVPVFIADLDSPQLDARLAAVNSLGALGPISKAALPWLKEMARTGDFGLKQAALNAIERIEAGPAPGPPDERDQSPDDPPG